MAAGRNSHIAEGKVLFNLKNYSSFLMRDMDEESKILKDLTISFNMLGGEESAFKDITDNFKRAISKSKKNVDKCMDLSNAVNAILQQSGISEEQQQLLIEHAKDNISDPDTRQFIASYLQNYTDAKKVKDNSNSQQVDSNAMEAEINAAASAFFVNAKAKEKEAKAKAVEEEAKVFFASAMGNKTNKPTPPARVYTGPSFIEKLFLKKVTNQGPTLNLNGEDKGNTKKR